MLRFFYWDLETKVTIILALREHVISNIVKTQIDEIIDRVVLSIYIASQIIDRVVHSIYIVSIKSI